MWKHTVLFTLALIGCPWIGDDAHHERLDLDGDGVQWPDDCGPDDKNVFPGAPERCNAVDDDCDDAVDEDAVDAPTWYRDTDGDTWGDGGVSAVQCAAPVGFVDRPGDCDDGASAAHPGLTEVCDDHLDNDCDGDDNGCDVTGLVLLAEVDFEGVGVDASDAYGTSIAYGPLDATAGGDLVIGAPGAKVAGISRGAVYLHGGPLPVVLDGIDGVRIDGNVDASQVGWTLALLDDVDGDGDGDLLVGAPAYSSYTGAAYLLRGPNLAAGTVSQGQIGVGSANSHYGQAVASLGDVNADGRTDFAIAAEGSESSAVSGYTYLFRGPALSIYPSGAIATLKDPCGPTGVAGPGDVDGDGVPDVLVASADCDAPFTGGGAAWLVPGDATGTVVLADAATRFVADGEGQVFGHALPAHAGDVDGDGRPDVAFGSPGWRDADSVVKGRVLLFTGAPTGEVRPASATARIAGATEGWFGFSVDLGDLNGDGFDDLVVGAPLHPVGTDVHGAAFLFYGPVVGDLTAEDADAVFLGPANSYAGYPVRVVGDVDGDGFDDLFVGAPGSSVPGTVFGFLGRGR